MGGERILVIEDEADIQELVRFNLEKERYIVDTRDNGEDGLALALAKPPALVVLDLMLPGMDGLSVCRKLRTDDRTRSTPVIMLTAKGEESDVVAGLEIGADDYVTKPFSPRVLVARVRAMLRRQSDDTEGDEAQVLRRGELEIDALHHEVRIAGKPLTLTLSEFRLLETLAKRPGVVFTRYQIVDAVKGEDYAVTDRSVDVQVVGLRRKLGKHSRLVETVRGVGYRFAASH